MEAHELKINDVAFTYRRGQKTAFWAGMECLSTSEMADGMEVHRFTYGDHRYEVRVTEDDGLVFTASIDGGPFEEVVEKLSAWQNVLAYWPLVLVAFGGAIGGLLGGLAAAINVKVIRGGVGAGVAVGVSISTGLLAIVGWALIVQALGLGR